jgi:hypothetical protein
MSTLKKQLGARVNDKLPSAVGTFGIGSKKQEHLLKAELCNLLGARDEPVANFPPRPSRWGEVFLLFARLPRLIFFSHLPSRGAAITRTTANGLISFPAPPSWRNSIKSAAPLFFAPAAVQILRINQSDVRWQKKLFMQRKVNKSGRLAAIAGDKRATCSCFLLPLGCCWLYLRRPVVWFISRLLQLLAYSSLSLFLVWLRLVASFTTTGVEKVVYCSHRAL